VRGFFKNRGYEDAADLTKYQIAKLPDGPTLKSFSFPGKQLFEKPDATKLKNGKVLNDVGKYLEQTKFGLVVILAKAGLKGDSEKDRILTQGRALVVRDYLVKNFKVDDTRIKTMGLGKTDAADDERKVDILVYPDGKPIRTSAVGGFMYRRARALSSQVKYFLVAEASRTPLD
jgi:outer membrane protein OmpA-like peptidoglycan-associated protein